LEYAGFVTPDNVFGAAPYYYKDTEINTQNAILYTAGAQYFQTTFNMAVNDFEYLAYQCIKFITSPSDQKKPSPQYRSIDGQGNNLEHPDWGVSNSIFLRLGTKNYQDGIHMPKNLPNARSLAHDLLTKAYRRPNPPQLFNVFASLTILFVTHDVHYQVPVQPQNVNNEILCCSRDGRDVLSPTSSNSACLPIEVSRTDSFYKQGDIGCLNMVRSQLSQVPGKVQPGEIRNYATSYIDLSLIYGNQESELKQIRLYQGGKLRLGKNNLLAVDSDQNYLPTMLRFIRTPLASIWPGLFFRNHNYLAEELAKLNSNWVDETIFQEARRINIASFQYNLISTGIIELALNSSAINETYSADINPGTLMEFAFAYRGSHYYLHDDMLFLDANNKTKTIKQSDTLGKPEIIVDGFDDALRGTLSQAVNTGPYSEDITSKIAKNSRGYGVDLIAIDIQRGRDHGMPSYLDIRRKCNLSPAINSFDDFNKIFNKTNVELLKKFYASPEHVDFYVGGILEIFQSLGEPLAGPTFGCVVGLSYNHFAGGDRYYYSNPKNPYPFTEAQLNSIRNYSISNIICKNSGLTKANTIWPYAITPDTSSVNSMVDCKNFPPMDLSPWKNVRA